MDLRIKIALDNRDNIFLSGPGGSGKSYQSQRIVEYLGEGIAIAAPTGAAAIQVGGVTLHSLLGLGMFLGSVDSLVQRMKKARNGDLVKRWCNMTDLLIDEISMMDVCLFLNASEVVRIIRKDVYHNPHRYEGLKVSGITKASDLDTPWGGIRLILVGDFLQLPPIQSHIEDTDEGSISYRYLFEHPIWDRMNLCVIYLTEPKRFQIGGCSDEDINAYFNILSDIRMGILSDRVREFIKMCSKKPQAKKIPSIDSYTSIYPTILIATNKEVDKINTDQLKKLKGEEHTYQAIFRCTSKDPAMSREDMIRSCLASDMLTLKIGAQVMLLINKMDMKLCNGSRGVVIGFKDDVSAIPIVQFINGQILAVEPHTWSCCIKMKDDEKHRASLSQIPLRLAYAISIHKSQGITAESVYVALDTCFESSQIYVALSRCSNMENLYIKGWSEYTWRKCLPDKKALQFYKNLKQ